MRQAPPFNNLRSYLLIIGNTRTGSTLLSALLDAHPHMMIANESLASMGFWRVWNKPAILANVWRNSKLNFHTERTQTGYAYNIDYPYSPDADAIRVVGDKIYKPATLMLHGDPGLLDRLQQVLGLPIKVVHPVRNPFDVIATMHNRSGAPLRDRALWYFSHCNAVSAIKARLPKDMYLDCRHDVLLQQPDQTIAELCRFVGEETPPDYLAACKKVMFNMPRRTRSSVVWDDGLIEDIQRRLADYDFLDGYTFDD